MTQYFGPRSSGVIFAADLPTYDDNARVLSQTADLVDVIKVNTPLVFREGMQVIRRLRETFGCPVFADLKIADVPHTNARVVEMVREHGGAAVMVHGIIGIDGFEECLQAAGGELGVIMQLELTNPGGKLFTQPIANDMARIAAMLDVYGVQAPGNRPERIREIRSIVGTERVIVCCGVGHQGGSYREVTASGGTYAIIGRSIYLAEKPREVLEGILREADQPLAAAR